MPEGDTIRTLADAIAPHLQGRRLARFELAGDATLDLAGRRVERVHARGKHLLVDVEGGLVLRTHLGMHGSWHRYAPDEAWQRPARHASLVLGTADDVFVCFHAREAECLRAGHARVAGTLGRLGPDLLAEGALDVAAIVRRARALCPPEAPLADVLLHQGVACGIGNVYKAELLFLAGLHPLRRLDAVDDACLAGLYTRARELLGRNVGGGPRVTREAADGVRAWVYGRAGEPCLRCGTALAGAVLGTRRRVTVWCPGCQK